MEDERLAAAQDRCRRALVIAGELAEHAGRAGAIVDSLVDGQAVAEAEMITRSALVQPAYELARELLADLYRDGAIVERVVPGVEQEQQPIAWVGRMEGTLLSLVVALEDAGIVSKPG